VSELAQPPVEPVLPAPVWPMLRLQTVAQARIFWRTPALSAVSMLLPIMLFVFFGLPNASTPYLPGVTLGTYMLASFAAYAVASTMVFGFGITLALARGQRIDVLMRSTPLPGSVYMVARAVAALGFGLLSLVALYAVAIVAAGIRLGPDVWIEMALWMLLGAIPFIFFGFFIAYATSPGSAPAVANMVFLVMVFASGLFVRLDQLPDFLATIAPFMPTYHYAQLAWASIGAPSQPVSTSVAWLVGYSVVFFALSLWAYRRDARRRFG
jgi:ABC-2 type transport system permease protein